MIVLCNFPITSITLIVGRQLFECYPAFRDSILRMDRHYESITGLSLIRQTGLFTDARDTKALPEIWPIAITLPALAMVQMALYDLFVSAGVVPDVLVGHSAGETAMLYCCGAASQAMALELAIVRGIVLTPAEDARGAMAALACSPEEAQSIVSTVLRKHPDMGLEIACYNSRDSVTVSGSEALIAAAIELASERRFFARKLRTRVAGHSAMMDAYESAYMKRAGHIFASYPGEHRPRITTYSSVTGLLWDEPFSPSYFWAGTRSPVLFHKAVLALLKRTPSASFIEISPHPALASYLSDLSPTPGSVFSPMRRTKNIEPFSEANLFLETLGGLAVSGHNCINFQSLNRCEIIDNHAFSFPFPFVRKPIAYYPEHSTTLARQMRSRNGPLNHPDLRLSSLTHPILAQHIIREEAIMPATGYLEMV